MTRMLLSERNKNATITCSKCANDRAGYCSYPILMDFIEGAFRVTKLIHFSEDGLTCQLFREKVEE